MSIPLDVSGGVLSTVCFSFMFFVWWWVFTWSSQGQIAGREEYEIQFFLLLFDFVANNIHVPDQRYLGLNEEEGALGIQGYEFVEQRGCSGFRAPDDVDFGRVRVFGQLLECPFTNSACAADKEGDHAWRFRLEVGVGNANICDGDHIPGLKVMEVQRTVGRG